MQYKPNKCVLRNYYTHSRNILRNIIPTYLLIGKLLIYKYLFYKFTAINFLILFQLLYFMIFFLRKNTNLYYILITCKQLVKNL